MNKNLEEASLRNATIQLYAIGVQGNIVILLIDTVRYIYLSNTISVLSNCFYLNESFAKQMFSNQPENVFSIRATCTPASTYYIRTL